MDLAQIPVVRRPRGAYRPRGMIDVAFTRAELRPAQVTVVIDALRATATAVAALGAGYRRVLFTDAIDEALTMRGPGRILAGEERCLMPAGFDQGNSPADAARRRGDELVLATTNGTPAIIAATRTSGTVLLASMLNLAATIRRLHDLDGADLQLVCAGAEGAVALEDVYVAGRIADALSGPRTDAALAAEAVCRGYADPLTAFEAGAGATRLHAAGLGADITYCARESAVDVVAIAGARIQETGWRPLVECEAVACDMPRFTGDRQTRLGATPE